MRAEPYVATAAAMGVGFLLGGGLTAKTRMLLIGAGSRFLASWLGEEFVGSSDTDPR